MVSWNFLNSALQSGLGSATQFGRLQIAQDQNRRAEDEFQNRMLDEERARQREQELNQVQARIARALQAEREGQTRMPRPQSRGASPGASPGAPQDRPQLRTADEDYWFEKLRDPEMRKTRKTELQNLHALLNDPDNAEPMAVRDILNNVYGEILNQGGPEGARKRLKGWVPADEEGGRFVPMLEVEQPDGSRYDAPITRNRSNDPNDPVEALSMEDLLDDLDTQASIANVFDSLPELRARAIALGDDSELTRLYQQLEAESAEGRWRERQALLQQYGIDDRMLAHMLGLDEMAAQQGYTLERDEFQDELQRGRMGLEDELQRGRMGLEDQFTRGRMGLEDQFARGRMGLEDQFARGRLGVQHEQQLDVLNRQQQFQRGENQNDFQRQKELARLRASLTPPEVVTGADGTAYHLPRQPGEPALPINQRLMRPDAARERALQESGGRPTAQAGERMRELTEERPLKVPPRTGGSGTVDLGKARVNAFLEAKKAATESAMMNGTPVPSDDEILAHVDQLLMLQQQQQGQSPQGETMMPRPRRSTVLEGIRAYDEYLR